MEHGLDDIGKKRLYFYPETIRRVTAALGLYFKGIHVIRRDKYGEPIKDINVPVVFGPSDKQWAYKKELQSGRLYYQQRPKITYNMSSPPQFDANRAKSVNELRIVYDPWWKEWANEHKLNPNIKEHLWADLNPVAHNFNYKFQILGESMDDMCQIMEQIFVWFDPNSFLRVKELEFSNIERDLRMTISSSSLEFKEELVTDDELRVLTADFNIAVEGVLYKPIRNAVLVEIINSQFKLDGYKEISEELGLFGSYGKLNTSGQFKTERWPIPNDKPEYWETSSWNPITSSWDINAGYTPNSSGTWERNTIVLETTQDKRLDLYGEEQDIKIYMTNKNLYDPCGEFGGDIIPIRTSSLNPRTGYMEPCVDEPIPPPEPPEPKPPIIIEPCIPGHFDDVDHNAKTGNCGIDCC